MVSQDTDGAPSGGLNASEAYVFRLCHKTLLSLWSYANPLAPSGKELCDVLVVCPPDIVIISVKKIEVNPDADTVVQWERWQRKAVLDSERQIRGAQRRIAEMPAVIKSDGSTGLPLPAPAERRLHRIAVAFGGGRDVPVFAGDSGRGFVHVFDERALDVVLGELDTVGDFLKYLRDKEAFLVGDTQIMMNGGEEDLLACYLSSGRSFPNFNLLLLEDGLWDELQGRPEYLAKREENRISYLWDDLMEYFAKDALRGRLAFGGSLSDAEAVLRVMARSLSG